MNYNVVKVEDHPWIPGFLSDTCQNPGFFNEINPWNPGFFTKIDPWNPWKCMINVSGHPGKTFHSWEPIIGKVFCIKPT